MSWLPCLVLLERTHNLVTHCRGHLGINKAGQKIKSNCSSIGDHISKSGHLEDFDIRSKTENSFDHINESLLILSDHPILSNLQSVSVSVSYQLPGTVVSCYSLSFYKYYWFYQFPLLFFYPFARSFISVRQFCPFLGISTQFQFHPVYLLMMDLGRLEMFY